MSLSQFQTLLLINNRKNMKIHSLIREFIQLNINVPLKLPPVLWNFLCIIWNLLIKLFLVLVFLFIIRVIDNFVYSPPLLHHAFFINFCFRQSLEEVDAGITYIVSIQFIISFNVSITINDSEILLNSD